MGLTSMFSSKPDTQVYQTGAHTRTQNSRAYLLALIAYMGIFLFGYDTGVGGGVVSLKIFKQDFGYANADKKVIADNNSNVVSLLHVGAFFGALGAAPIVARTGRKWGLFIGCFIFLVGGVMSTAATHNLGPMIAGRVVCGFGVGVMSVVCPTYVSEMTPKEVRGRITGMFQIVVVVGVAFSYWITYAINVSRPVQTSASWRIPIAFQLVPCGIMLVLLPLIKESPRWLADKGRLDEALANLAWVRKRNIDDPYVVDEFNEICAAIEEEKANTSGASWKDTAKPGNRIRMFIAFAVFFLQQWSGQNSINYYAPEVFASIGLTGTSVGLLSSGIYGIVKIVATAAFIFLGIEKIGRKWALGFGGLGMSLFLWIIAAIFITHPVNKNLPEGATPPPSSMAMAAMIYLFVIPYCFSWGPVPWVYCAEIFPMRIRHFGMSTAAATQWCFNFVLTKLTPYLIIGLPGGKVFILFACTNLLSAAFGFWLPETSGVSLEDMDILFGATTREERDAHIAEMAQKRADPLSAKEKDLEGEYEHNEHVEPAVPANRAAA